MELTGVDGNRKRTFLVVCAALAVLSIHTAAYGQTARPADDDEGPPYEPSVDPDWYRYGYAPIDDLRLRLVSQSHLVYRPFMVSIGLGPGMLSGGSGIFEDHSVRTTGAGLSYAFRIGFGAADPRWLVVLALDGSWAELSREVLAGFSSWSSTTFTIGAQFYILPWLYSRLGIGLGCLHGSDETHDWSSCRGGAALAGGVGAEFFQSRRTSLGAELAPTLVRSPAGGFELGGTGVWFSLGVNLVVSMY
jgi:hypothetical protein